MSVLSRLIPTKIRQVCIRKASSGEGWFVLKHISNPLVGTMKTKPSDWAYVKASNIFLFYLTIWAAPLLAIATYTNIFIGPATLKPTPEGYEPKEEEYERHPITRWMAKNYHMSEQQKHEMELHARWEGHNEGLRKQLFAEAKRVIKENGDYVAYNYMPYSAHRVRIMMKKNQDHYIQEGTY